MLVFGQAELALQALVAGAADAIPAAAGRSGLARHQHRAPDALADIPRVLELPPWEEVSPMSEAGRAQFARMFREYLPQLRARRAGPSRRSTASATWSSIRPARRPPREQLDEIYGLPFTRRPHPSYGGARIPAYDMIKDSITTHRGCYAGCSFCAITVHQGAPVASRSQENILREIETLAAEPGFLRHHQRPRRPHGEHVRHALQTRAAIAARTRNCLTPDICPHLDTDHGALLELMAAGAPRRRRQARLHPKRHPLRSGAQRRRAKTTSPNSREHHVSGRLKIAPEHVSAEVLRHMQKPGAELYKEFLKRYAQACAAAGKDQYTVQYFISGHPGCTLEHMVELAQFLKDQQLAPEQVQDFYPAPLTLGMAMWHCGVNPLTDEQVYCAKTAAREAPAARAIFLPQSGLLARRARGAARMRARGFDRPRAEMPRAARDTARKTGART